MKKFGEWINYKQENNVYPLIEKFEIIDNFDLKSVCICQKDGAVVMLILK